MINSQYKYHMFLTVYDKWHHFGTMEVLKTNIKNPKISCNGFICNFYEQFTNFLSSRLVNQVH